MRKSSGGERSTRSPSCPPHECSDTILYPCSCLQTDKKRPKCCSYGKHRKIPNVLVEGWKCNMLQQRRFIHVASASCQGARRISHRSSCARGFSSWSLTSKRHGDSPSPATRQPWHIGVLGVKFSSCIRPSARTRAARCFVHSNNFCLTKANSLFTLIQ